MYLKRLEMQGFKSFVDKITLDFGEGITAIVGPNGSGKSNISDAIRWVLGEQSAKSLRGSKMEDVIFAGTMKRKPTGFAQVSLILDNSDKIFPIDYDEINVTRRVYRSGESEYFINKAACRLRDIHELFMDTGLGRDGYSIIGQGRIDEILSNKSEDRRQVFEEAAGIAKYKSKKTEAERKLASTEDNLIRLHDIAGELEARLDPLEKQSKRAAKYLTIHNEVKTLDISICADTLQKLKTDEKELINKVSGISDNVKNEEDKLIHLQEAEKELYGDMRKTDADIERVKEEIHKINIINTRTEGEISLLENSIQSLKDDIKKSELEIENTRSAIFNTEEIIKKTDEEISELEAKRKEKLDEIDTKNNTIIALGAETDKQNQALSVLLEERLALINEKEDIRGKISTIEALGSNTAERKKTLAGEIEEAQREIKETAEKVENLKNEIELLKKENEKLLKQHAEKLEMSKKLQEETNSLKVSYNEMNSEYNRKASRLSVLREMEKNMEGYGSGQRALLSGALKGEITVYGAVSKLIRLEDKYTAAVEASVGNGLQFIVVENDSDAKKAIDFLKQNRLGRVTFLPIKSVTGKRVDFSDDFGDCDGFLGTLSDIVECDGKFRDTVLYLMGRTALFDNIDNAISAAKKTKYRNKIVTLDGVVLNPGGSLTGGSLTKEGRLLHRVKEINELETACGDLQKKMDKTENTIDKNTESLYKRRDELDALLQKVTDNKNSIYKSEGETDLGNSLINRESQRILRDRAELSQIDTDSKNSYSEAEFLNKVLDEAGVKTEALEAKIEQLKEMIRINLSEKESRNQEIINIRIRVSDINNEIDFKKLSRIKEEQNGKMSQDKIKNLESFIASNDEKIRECSLNIENKLLDIKEAEKHIGEYNRQVDEMIVSRSKADEGILKIKDDSVRQNELVNSLKLEYDRLQNRLEKISSQTEETIARLWDDYEITPNEAEASKQSIDDLGAAKRRIAQLKAEMKSLGNINLDSIEEYKEVRERYTFLTEQIKDMDNSKVELLSLIKELTVQMTKQFAEKFEIINKNFSEVFTELFGGGSASLSLTDSENILESGIEIDVRPPGKKLQRLSLLSGGEMAFTAIALLFAILKVRAAPFCILDEIEAALDDNNIDRFGRYIKNFSDKTQFIIVTHRRGTMATADILYGVTMQEKGISKLLTMKLDDVAPEERAE